MMTLQHEFAEEKKDDSDAAAKETDVVKTTMMTFTGTTVGNENVKASPADKPTNGQGNKSKLIETKDPSSAIVGRVPFVVRLFGSLLRAAVIDFPLIMLFAALAATMLLHKVHDDYLLKQLKLMVFQEEYRNFAEGMYYHRYCSGDEVSATAVRQLVIPDNITAEQCAEHQMTHGVSVYRDLLTPETAHELREFIVEQNKIQEGFQVIQNKNRYSWGIDVNMHPAIKKYWTELGSNKVLVDALQEIVGPDPAIIEFTAITAAYGAKDQNDHQDVISPGSGAKFGHSFVPSYSLFIPLQDVSYNMGATHVCPGTHLCSDGCNINCPGRNLAMSGDDDNWPMGWGALVNQQTTHKGMGHNKRNGLDRVVIIATFAPRPQTFRGLETRMIGQGGSYSLAWHQWGHTFSDFVHADEQMWEPLKTMRALGLVKGNGWTLPTITSMRIANEDTGFSDDEDSIEKFLEKKGGFKFLPRVWQGGVEQEEGDQTEYFPNVWHRFLLGTLKRTKEGLMNLYKRALPIALAFLLALDLIRGTWTRRWTWPSVFFRGVGRLMTLHAVVAVIALWGKSTIDDSNWAKDIASGKAFQLPEPVAHMDEHGLPMTRATLPNELDILRMTEYASDHLAAYGRVVDFAHPGNAKWIGLVQDHANDYRAMSPDLQRDLCGSLLAYVRQDARFLKHGEEREWLPIEDEDELSDICHQDLLATSDKRVAAIVRQLDSLKTATQFGRFWNTALHRSSIPTYLRKLQAVLVPQRPWSVHGAPGAKAMKSSPFFKLLASPTTTPRPENRRRYSIPGSREPREPFPLAWVREFDVVEGMYNCKTAYYYRGFITAILASEATFDIHYDDGDEEQGIGLHCLRPFKPYQVGEKIQVRKTGDEWPDGTIVKMYYGTEDDDEEDMLLDIQLEESSSELVGMRSEHIRRYDDSQLKLGDSILARYRNGDEWLEGRIVKVHPDGTYYIKYAGGKRKEKSVPADRIRK